MTEQILADNRRTTTREDLRQAILQRTTRGMLAYNSGKVHRLEGELWAVPSTRGGAVRLGTARGVGRALGVDPRSSGRAAQSR